MPTEPWLKHLTVAVLAVCATVLAVARPELADGAMVLLGTIGGYVFKNGTATGRRVLP